MTLPLTEKQERVWRYIKSCKRSPTYSEMQRGLRLSSRGGELYRVIERLEQKGFVRRTKGVARSIVAVDPRIDLSTIPTAALAEELARRTAA